MELTIVMLIVLVIVVVAVVVMVVGVTNTYYGRDCKLSTKTHSLCIEQYTTGNMVSQPEMAFPSLPCSSVWPYDYVLTAGMGVEGCALFLGLIFNTFGAPNPWSFSSLRPEHRWS